MSWVPNQVLLPRAGTNRDHHELGETLDAWAPNHRGQLLRRCWEQWRTEQALRRKGIRFRTDDPTAAASAYSRMDQQEFAAINARQSWANWRTIPRLLRRFASDDPLRILDLGCGAGDSTQVLAYHAAWGSSIVGYDVVEPLLDMAREKTYRHANGRAVRPVFRRQSLLDPWSDGTDRVYQTGSIHLVNSSGLFGHHLPEAQLVVILDELMRVVAPGGMALLDVSWKLQRRRLSRFMRARHFRPLGYERSCLLDVTGQMAFRRE